MTNEEFQKIVLEKLTGLEKITTNIERIESKIEGVEGKFERIESKIDKLAAEGQEDIKAMLGHIDKKLDAQNEIIDDKFDALNDRLFSQETQLQRLKKLAK
ncbi:chaperonin cofactor prefoldin [Sporomusaceae bacterium BoRhaA]|uniref:hypothetical protein n=1 Tax=Pelorhabdus rhamnosifermentans TaxID=2772457 RepID=UPI001C0617AF|nr:hypothetical protein [Pelorhabdus rhamnosifermentans]MBU2699122.1 chaperonin cofactor prefoldin [Pelorhabdus rhamnosifermentans]